MRMMRKWFFRLAPSLYLLLSQVRKILARPAEPRKSRKMKSLQFGTPSDLLRGHYETWVRGNVPNRRDGFAVALEALGGRPAQIIETGTSAWGIDSTRLFDSYIHQFGGKFWTVDLRSEPSQRLAKQLSPQTTAVIGDSVEFLRKLSTRCSPVDLIYLDSFDLDWNDPSPSAQHCLEEWRAAKPLCDTGTVVIIDDTPQSLGLVPDFDQAARSGAERHQLKFGRMPGKGELVLKEISQRPDIKVLHHGYNLVFQFC